MKKLKVCFAALGILAAFLLASCSNNSDAPQVSSVSSGSARLFSSTALLPSEGFSLAPNSVIKQIRIDESEGTNDFEWNEAPVVESGAEQQTTCKTFSLTILRRYFFSDENGIAGYCYSGEYKFTLDWSAENWENRLALAAQKEKELAETDFKWCVGSVYNWGDVPRIIKSGSDYYLGWTNGSVNASSGIASGVTNRDPGVYIHETKTLLGWQGLYCYNQEPPDSASTGWNHASTAYYSERPTLKDAATGTFSWTPYLCDQYVEKANFSTTLYYNDGTVESIEETKPKNGLYKTQKNKSSAKWSRSSDGLITIGDANDSKHVVVDGVLWGFDPNGTFTNEDGPANAELREKLDYNRDHEKWYEVVVLP